MSSNGRTTDEMRETADRASWCLRLLAADAKLSELWRSARSGDLVVRWCEQFADEIDLVHSARNHVVHQAWISEADLQAGATMAETLVRFRQDATTAEAETARRDEARTHALDTPERRQRAFCGNASCPCADVKPACPEYMDPNNRRLFENARGRCARCGNHGDVHPPMPEGAEPGWSLR